MCVNDRENEVGGRSVNGRGRNVNGRGRGRRGSARVSATWPRWCEWFTVSVRRTCGSGVDRLGMWGGIELCRGRGSWSGGTSARRV